jgi:hypothetical protein
MGRASPLTRIARNAPLVLAFAAGLALRPYLEGYFASVSERMPWKVCESTMIGEPDKTEIVSNSEEYVAPFVPSRLLNLPSEVLAHISLHMSVRDICTAQAVRLHV